MTQKLLFVVLLLTVGLLDSALGHAQDMSKVPDAQAATAPVLDDKDAKIANLEAQVKSLMAAVNRLAQRPITVEEARTKYPDAFKVKETEVRANPAALAGCKASKGTIMLIGDVVGGNIVPSCVREVK